MFTIGMWVTYSTSYLNIASTAGLKYDHVFYDPYLFIALTGLESYGYISSELMLFFFMLQGMLLVAKYLRFMHYLVTELTEYLGISLLFVKEGNDSDNNHSRKIR